MSNVVRGSVAPGWGPVEEAFLANFAEHGEVGAGVAVYHHGKLVVDLTGGVFDTVSQRPYDDHTLQLVFSTTKGATAVCAALLAQRGLLDLDAPVARYWPEFAAAGKAEVPVRFLLNHQVGLPTVDRALSAQEALDWDTVCAALAEQAPYWEPGSAHGYHALTYGHLVGEVVRRVDGRSLGRFFADEVAAPLGLEFWIGLPESLEDRVSPLVTAPPPPPEVAAMMAMMMGPETLGGRALSLNGAMGATDPSQTPFNRRDFHAAEIPAANGITNARSLARMYAGLIGDGVDGVRLLEPVTMNRFRTRTTAAAPDRCLLVETAFGLGFMVHTGFAPMLADGGFGHPGAGGSLGMALPEQGVAFGYVMNKMQMNLAGDPRVSGLQAAVLACL